MSKSNKLRKWIDVYPQGTKTGDEEQKFFIALARNPKYEWRTVAALTKETGLPKVRVEEIIQKYHKNGMVLNNTKNEEQWAYWERVPDAVKEDPSSLAQSDQKDRVNKAMGKPSLSNAPVAAAPSPTKKMGQKKLIIPSMVNLKDAPDTRIYTIYVSNLTRDQAENMIQLTKAYLATEIDPVPTTEPADGQFPQKNDPVDDFLVGQDDGIPPHLDIQDNEPDDAKDTPIEDKKR